MRHEVIASGPNYPWRIGNRTYRTWAICTCGWWEVNTDGKQHLESHRVRPYPF